MMKKLMLVLVVVFSFFLSGCNYLKVVNYTPHERTFTKAHKINGSLLHDR